MAVVDYFLEWTTAAAEAAAYTQRHAVAAAVSRRRRRQRRPRRSNVASKHSMKHKDQTTKLRAVFACRRRKIGFVSEFEMKSFDDVIAPAGLDEYSFYVPSGNLRPRLQPHCFCLCYIRCLSPGDVNTFSSRRIRAVATTAVHGGTVITSVWCGGDGGGGGAVTSRHVYVYARSRAY
ncbi:hypothetical protein NECAME_10777 [Necator americanus]|uniref:Uncharacterized protein n=1 Tax=Necator americanus TaxID=51031 RepID=W2T744_NECAM|nr:hypothetical protein NECAME_10777 [Necator americanus]ETN77825.1 hypothetical protein NECAME_10777 [Necator americanus]